MVSWINLLKNHVNVFHLTWVMSLHYLVKCSSRTCYHWGVKEINSRIYLILTVAAKFTRFESSWLQNVENSAKEDVQDTHHWSGNGNSNWERNGPSWITSSLQQPFVSGIISGFRLQISDAYFVHLLLQYSAHAIISWMQIWRIWMPQLRWDNFWSFFL